MQKNMSILTRRDLPGYEHGATVSVAYLDSEGVNKLPSSRWRTMHALFSAAVCRILHRARCIACDAIRRCPPGPAAPMHPLVPPAAAPLPRRRPARCGHAGSESHAQRLARLQPLAPAMLLPCICCLPHGAASGVPQAPGYLAALEALFPRRGVLPAQVPLSTLHSPQGWSTGSSP
jgi:hypothetical protein